MAKETRAELWIGADHQFIFTVLNASSAAAVDITGWALSWMVKRQAKDTDATKLLQMTTALGSIAISGTYAAAPEANTQVATVTVADTDTDAIAPGLYRYELKRTDGGLEAPLAYGAILFRQGVHRT